MSNIVLRFVDSGSADFKFLTQKLDEYYISLVGDVHLRYAAFNNPLNFACRIVVYHNDNPVACGCWKAVDTATAEIKRIYVLPAYRRMGIASKIILALEQEISASGRNHIVLETARTTPDSEALYVSLNYTEMSYYGSLAGAENCLCFEKKL